MSKRKKARRGSGNIGTKVPDNKPKNRNLGLIVGAGALALATIAGTAALWYNNRVADSTSTQLEETLNRETESFDVSKYGRVSTYNDGAPSQLYIIPQQHKLATKKDIYFSSETPRIMVEVYRIAEQLIRYKSVQLLLAEGLSSRADNWKLLEGLGHFSYTRNLEDSELENEFRTIKPLAASLLLGINYPQLDFQGADNEGMVETQLKLAELPLDKEVRALFDYTSRIRSANAIYSASLVINREFGKGRIQNKNAMIIMGADHLDDIIGYFQQGRIFIPPARIAGVYLRGLDATLNLGQLGYTIVVIKPLSIK